MKKCSKCKQPGSFYKDKNASGGFRSICKTCDKAKASRWNKANSERHTEHEKSYRESNRDQMRLNKKNYVSSNPRSVKNSGLKFNYGIDINQYDLMKSQQNNCCAICFKNEDELPRDLCVDHCHKTGKIRKLLCARCNSALGFIDDNVDFANRLHEYLKEHNG